MLLLITCYHRSYTILMLSIMTAITMAGLASARSSSSPPEDTTLSVLDEMNQYILGGGQFDRRLHGKIKGCLNYLDPSAYGTQNKIFDGLVKYWETRGGPDDKWGGYLHDYVESNATITNNHHMEITEPCNSASNTAYYHTMLELCLRKSTKEQSCISDYITPMRKSLAYLVPSSYFHHASSTKLGIALDHKIIDVMFYLAHQASVQGVPYNPILHDLSETPNPIDSLQALKLLENMFNNEDVQNWREALDSITIPPRTLTIGAFVTSSLSLGSDPWVINTMAPILSNTFGMNRETQNFLFDKYIPTFIKETDYIKLNHSKRTKLLVNSVTSIAKLGYSYAWLNANSISRSKVGSIVNILGSLFLPGLNLKLNLMNNYSHNNELFQQGINAFPGEEWCNPLYPHTKWHVQTAIGLVDWFKMSNEMCEISLFQPLISTP